MATGSVRHFFPGGNTPQGFVSYYDYVISPNAKRIFILKGGPGTGKSTFMKRMGTEMTKAGYDVEQHHCSSDNNSLDGLVIPALQIAFIDGTSPHIVDPKHPGAVDEIIHLGDFWDEKGIVDHKADIMHCNQKIKVCFQRAYRLLRAARSVYDDWEAINTAALDFGKANKMSAEVTEKILSGVHSTSAGKTRKLFASAITPNGPVNYLESLATPTTYVVTGLPGTGKATLIQKIVDSATAKGLDAEVFYCPFDPLKPEHIVIPAIGAAVITSTEPHTYPGPAAAIIHMDECLKPALIAPQSEYAAYDKTVYQELFNKAINSIQQAKQLHDDLETYYIPYMDFVKIETLWRTTLNRVLAYAK